MLTSLLVALSAFGQVAAANIKPQIGYVYPPGGRAGQTIEVRLGTYDWTPDMELFAHDPRIKLEITGPAGEPILTPPPYWFGLKAGQVQPPLPREIPAKITIPAGYPPGPIRWQAANANGGTNVGQFIVSDHAELVEPEENAAPLDLPPLPAAVSGRISRIREIDVYRFTVPQGGLVVCRLSDNLGQPFHGMVTIRDAATGKVVADHADTTGDGAVLLFTAQPGQTYAASVTDVEYAGDRGYVYRLSIAREPLVVATLPLVVLRGAVTPVEFVGWGVKTGKQQLESVTHAVSVPAGAAGDAFPFTFDTPAGKASASLALSPFADLPLPAADAQGVRPLAVPAAISGALDQLDRASQMPQARFRFTAVKGDAFLFRALAADYRSPVDPSLAILDAEGKELARNDDLPTSTDAALAFTAPADGAFDLVLSDLSGVAPSRASVFRLLVDKPDQAFDFSLQVPDKYDLPLGATADLVLKPARSGAWQEPIEITLTGLPSGVTVQPLPPPPPEPPVDPKAKKKPAPKKPAPTDIKVTLVSAADAPAAASLVMLTAKATVGDRTIERQLGPILITTTLKTRCKVKSAVQDGGRIVNRGSTYPADLLIERLEDYTGPVTLQMAATQQRQRRGIRGGTLIVPAGVEAVQYPVFMPEWLETSLTARMNVIGVVQVPDPKGNIRHVTGVMDGFIVMSLEGALLKLSHEAAERSVALGGQIEIPVRVSRSATLPLPAKIELVAAGPLAGLITAEPINLAPSESSAVVKLKLANDPHLLGNREITLRVTALRDGKWPCISETTVPLLIEARPPVAQAP